MLKAQMLIVGANKRTFRGFENRTGGVFYR
jgi:hypothetical protein